MSKPDGQGEASPGGFQPERLRRIGLVVGASGVPLFLLGVGTAIDYLCCQSHPVPPAVAFSLKLEFTVAGLLLMATGFGLVVLPPRSTT